MVLRNDNGSNGVSVNYWQIGAIAISLIGQTWWIASKVGTLDAQVVASERRLTVIEQSGSPSLQGIRTELAITTHRVDTLEQAVNSKLDNLVVTLATVSTKQLDVMGEIVRLRDWRAAAIPQMSEIVTQQSNHQAELDRLRLQHDQHEVQDRETALRTAAIEARLNSYETKPTVISPQSSR